MRVMVDTTYARRAPLSGAAVYVERLCEELARFDEVEVVEGINEKRRPPAGGGLGSARNLARDLYWTAVELPRAATRAGAQLIHHPLPAFSPRASLPQVVTVLDLAFERLPECYHRAFRTFAHHSHRLAARHANAIVCVSETTAHDVRDLWQVHRERIVIAPLGPGQELSLRRPPEDSGPGHFLYVGDEEPRKDLRTLLAAYRLYRDRVEDPLELVLAGSAGANGEGVRIVRRPGAHRLTELYVQAVALVHPSLYEGFGMTPIEAMRLGTPVLAARSPGVVEVCADAARYANPRDPLGFAQAMVEISKSESLRADLAQRGARRAEQLSWTACARAHVDAYSLALRA